MHERVGACQDSGHACSIVHKAGEPHAGRCHSLETRALGAVAEQDKNGFAAGSHPGKGLEDDVPPLFDGETPHADKQHSSLSGAV